MFEIIAAIAPIVIITIIYFVRLETRLTKILTDLCWIKKELVKCQPNLEKSSQ
jgi:hypothetical protein